MRLKRVNKEYRLMSIYCQNSLQVVSRTARKNARLLWPLWWIERKPTWSTHELRGENSPRCTIRWIVSTTHMTPPTGWDLILGGIWSIMNEIRLPTKVFRRLGFPFNQPSTIVLSVHANMLSIEIENKSRTWRKSWDGSKRGILMGATLVLAMTREICTFKAESIDTRHLHMMHHKIHESEQIVSERRLENSIYKFDFIRDPVHFSFP